MSRRRRRIGGGLLFGGAPAEDNTLTHFVKSDLTARTTISTTAEEQANYTIAWADLTAPGFADSDDVFILVAQKQRVNDANSNSRFAVGFGATYAGRVDDATSAQRAETTSTGAVTGEQYVWIDRRDLVANENIYFSINVTGNTGTYEEFHCLILRLDDLTSNDFVYNEVSIAANAPDAYDTNGASVTVPLTGDWLFIANARFLVDAIDDDYMFLAIHNGTADVNEIKSDGEDLADERVLTTMAYQAAIASNTVVQARHRVTTAATHDIVTSKIFGLRLGAFLSASGTQNTTTITHSVVDTFQEFAGFGAYSHPATGPLLVMGWPIHATGAATQAPEGRIQIGGSDWPVASANSIAIRDNGTAARIAPFLLSYSATEAAGTKDIDLDTCEDQSVAAAHDSNAHVAVAISLTLAA
jgi:hypothetical protein